MDLIDRAEVHDLIAKRLSDYLTDESREELEELDIKVEEDIPTVQAVPTWIPVNERLPEHYQNILFSTKTDRVFEGRYFKDETEHQWYSFRDECFAWNNVVTAWMPLPEPYKPQERSDKG